MNDSHGRLGEWVDSKYVCDTLKISQRTLQTFRDNGKLAYTQIERKITRGLSPCEMREEKFLNKRCIFKLICGYLPEMVDTHFSFNTIKL